MCSDQGREAGEVVRQTTSVEERVLGSGGLGERAECRVTRCLPPLTLLLEGRSAVVTPCFVWLSVSRPGIARELLFSGGKAEYIPARVKPQVKAFV